MKILYARNLYKQEFQDSVDEYNSKQIRDDRKIKDYFTHVSNNSKNDLACEIIIELGNKKYWDTKDLKFKKKMICTVFFRVRYYDAQNQAKKTM